ncbi:hypothetical protein [Xenorhabdus bovienii]
MISDWLPTFTTIATPRLLRAGTLPPHRPLWWGAYWLARLMWKTATTAV